MNYHLWLEDAAKGPFTINQLRAMWTSGQLTGQNMFSQDGCQNWHYLSDILAQLEPPPIPAASPPVVVRIPAKQHKANIILVILSTILVIATLLATAIGILNRSGTDDYSMSNDDFSVAAILFVISLISIGVTKIK